MHKYAESFSEKRVILIISLSAATGLLLSIGNIGLWGFIIILTLYVGEHVLYPFMSEILNNQIVGNERATALSVASFMRMLPYVILAPLIGYLNVNGKLHYFLAIWAGLIVFALLIYLSNKKRDEMIKIEE